ncbi:MAG: metallophosphatase family protein [Sphingobacterium sp.]|jgi:putative phosphoesterase|uniref:metallophosphoesterase family protein n=1 Tax=unclassified Sphingobacterium TaxID=2609468 RepID=UPI0028466302|nr:metallophosphoesterase family protein [Sphingobacterium sp.]MDR3010742.1 metallophosphatase family protein [Sphingobacterium sp.]
MKIQLAIISDIHANIIALDAVLADISKRDITQIYCLGDLVDFAPWGNEVIARIQEKNILCLLGNHDQRIAFDEAIIPLPHHDAKETLNREIAINLSKKEISAPHKKWLATLPYNIELTFKIGKSLRKILLVHASLQSNDEYIHQSSPKADLSAQLKKRTIDILVMGHTHHSYVQQSEDILFVNCGSVGRSKEKDRKATYSIITLSKEGMEAQIVKVDYSITEVAKAIYSSDIPDFYGDFLIK